MNFQIILVSSSLLHGDLWGGNYMFLTNGQPALFDPHHYMEIENLT